MHAKTGHEGPNYFFLFIIENNAGSFDFRKITHISYLPSPPWGSQLLAVRCIWCPACVG